MLENLLDQYGLSTEQRQMLVSYIEAIEKWPGNLTNWTGKELWVRGVLESLELRQYFPNPVINALDIGSGAGFPGLPLAVVMPTVQWTLIDSRSRRVEFLESVCEQIGLKNVKVVCDRAEQFIRDYGGARDGFDVVTARAVAAVPNVVELGLPFLREGGILIIPTRRSNGEGTPVDQFIRDLGGDFEWVEGLIPMGNGTQQVLRIIKKRLTPALYPRNAKKLGQLRDLS